MEELKRYDNEIDKEDITNDDLKYSDFIDTEILFVESNKQNNNKNYKRIYNSLNKQKISKYNREYYIRNKERISINKKQNYERLKK